MSVPQVAVIDYDMGNRRSVEKALAHVGAEAQITRDPARLDAADALVLPGVGSFPVGMANLKSFGLDSVIRENVEAGKPLLGICLGMQLLFEASSEMSEGTNGLALIGGQVRPLRAGGLRIPHIGWSEVRIEHESPLTSGISAAGAPFYHVHSYIAEPSDRDTVVGTAEYGERFATVVRRGCVHGTQFHPEKSSTDGLALLADFLKLVNRSQATAVKA
jgi:imidazole glycerol-phosphate synthase subunit HisH